MNDLQGQLLRTKIFVCYSHADAEWLERLQVHFAPLGREGTLELWDDTRIQPGERWRNAIVEALNESAVAILLISPDFLASDFIMVHELPRLLAAEEERGLTVLPVHISPYDYESSDFAQIQGVNRPTKTIIDMSRSEREKTFVNLAQEARRVLAALFWEHEKASKVHRQTNDGLDYLPPAILNKTSLTTLFLTGNVLKELPADFKTLDKLTTLYLNKNAFTVFPEVVFSLPKLRELYFSDNRLESVPSSIVALANLKTLRLARNQLTHIPSEIGLLPDLTTLVLAENKLERVPSELGLLTDLVELDLSNNALNSLPSELKNLTGLQRLCLHGNPVVDDLMLEDCVDDPQQIFELLFGA